MGDKVVITADWHVHKHGGDPQALEECLRAAKWVYDVARKHGAKAVVHAGDVFEDRKVLEISAYQRVYDTIVEAHDDGIETTILLGNHDMFHLERWDTSSIKPLERVARVVMSPSTLEICGERWDFMPYTARPAAMIERHFPPETRGGKYFVGHFGVNDAIMNGLYGTTFSSREETADAHREMFGGYIRAFLGHFHKRQVLGCGNAEFIGSPLQLNFGEAGDKKAVAVLDVQDGIVTYEYNDFSPRYIISSNPQEVLDMECVRGCHVRIDLGAGFAGDVLEVKRKIEQKHRPASCTVRPPKPGAKVRDARTEAMQLQEKPSDRQKVAGGIDSLVIVNDHEEIVRRYANACAMSEEAMQVGIDIIRSVKGNK